MAVSLFRTNRSKFVANSNGALPGRHSTAWATRCPKASVPSAPPRSGLRHRVFGAGIERGGEPQAARSLARLVGKNFAIHIGGDDDLEWTGVAHQQGRQASAGPERLYLNPVGSASNR